MGMWPQHSMQRLQHYGGLFGWYHLEDGLLPRLQVPLHVAVLQLPAPLLLLHYQ